MKTTIHYYRFNTENIEEAQAYAALCEQLRATPGRGHWLHVLADTTDRSRTRKHGESEMVELETNYFFSNQWNTAEPHNQRVFDWYEGIYPNRHIRAGHYLDITPEMIELRDNTHVCGYCGKLEPAQRGYVFCPHCLGSAYLKETELHLLRMLPVSQENRKRPELTQAERDHLLPLYIEAQTREGHERANKRAKETRARLEREYHKTLENAEDKYNGFIWLMDHDVNIDNCIYYDHAGKFSFGWRNPVSEAVKSQLLDVLCEFPYDYEIKAA